MGIARVERDLIDATDIEMQAAKFYWCVERGVAVIAYGAWGAVSMNP
jgi:hypothetical protein